MTTRLIALLSSALAMSVACLGQPTPALVFEQKIPLPGVKGRIDHLSFDAAGQRLFVSALGNGTVEVLDIARRKPVHEILGLKEPQGVLFDEADNRVYVASGGDGTIRSYDGDLLTPMKTVHLGDDADNLRYDPRTKEILVGYGSGGIASFTKDLEKTSDVQLPSHPESFQIEQHGAFIFVNLPKSLSIGVIDRSRNELIHQWHESEALANFPMALDEKNRRLFVGFRTPARLLVLDADHGKTIAQMPITGDADDLFYDSSRHRIYVIGGAGSLDVIDQLDGDHYKQIDELSTSPGARTGLFVPSRSRLFIAAPQHGSEPAAILVYRVQ